MAEVRKCYGVGDPRPQHLTEPIWLEAPAVLYLISHPAFRALKIGVTGSRKIERIEVHIAHGWELVDEWPFPMRYDALRAEEAVLDRWRNLYSQKPRVPSTAMPQGGASETIRDSPGSRSDTIDFVRQIVETEHDISDELLEEFVWDPWTEESDPHT